MNKAARATKSATAKGAGLARVLDGVRAAAAPATTAAPLPTVEKKRTGGARKPLPAMTVEGARVIRRISPRMALIERIAVVSALNLEVGVTLYHCTCDAVVFETKDRAAAVAWLKANRPARAAAGGSRTYTKRPASAYAALAARHYNKLERAVDKVDFAKGDQAQAVRTALKVVRDALLVIMQGA